MNGYGGSDTTDQATAWHESTERRRSFTTSTAEGGAIVVSFFRTESRRRSDSRNHPLVGRSEWLAIDAISSLVG